MIQCSFILSLFITSSTYGQLSDDYDFDFLKYKIQIDEKYNSSIDGVMGPSPLSLQSLIQDRNQFHNYEEFLKYLKDKAPEIFDRPVFLHHTGSLQRATFNNPRVLLFGRGAVLSLAQPLPFETPKVEMIEWSPNKQSFQMGEIEFIGPGDIKIEANPKRCLACHGDNPNPIWAPYDLWPKAYGAKAGTIASKPEQSHYQNFISHVNKVGIYRHLPMDRLTLKSSLESYTQFLFTLNNLRWMSLLKSKKETIKHFQYALTATLNGCTLPIQKAGRSQYKVNDFFPPHIASSMPFPKKFFEEDGQKSREKLLKYLQATYERIFPEAQYSFEVNRRLDFEVPIIAHSRYILENLGFNWRDISMGHGENDYSIQNPSLLYTDLGTSLIFYNPSPLP